MRTYQKIDWSSNSNSFKIFMKLNRTKERFIVRKLLKLRNNEQFIEDTQQTIADLNDEQAEHSKVLLNIKEVWILWIPAEIRMKLKFLQKMTDFFNNS